MANDNSNWLSFSLSPMEMLSNSSTSQSQMLQSPPPFGGSSPAAAAQPYCFVDNYYYANGWENARAPSGVYGGDNGVKEVIGRGVADSNFFANFAGQQIQQEAVVAPKLEDFLGGNNSSLVQYSDSQTETQDSSLTQIYEQRGSPFFNVHSQDFRTVQAMAAGLQAFSSNSGSEVDDSVSVAGSTRVNCGGGGQSTESGTELANYCPNPGALSLGGSISNTQSNEKSLVCVDSGSCKKIVDTFGQRTSIYRGVTRHRWTGRYEAHLWDNSCRREGQARKGRQVYLGGYDKEDRAARSYDLAALKYWGPTATTNFPVSSYSQELEEMKHATKQEFIASLRRKSSGFSRGASKYRGVTRHHQQGRWQARIGRVAGNKDLYLGTFATQEEAAEAYDIAAIKFRGTNAVTNFEMNRYDVEAIMTSSLPVGGAAKRLKLSLEAEQKPNLNHHAQQQQQQLQCGGGGGNGFNFSSMQQIPAIPYEVPLDAMARYHHNLLQLHSSNTMPSDTTASSASMVTPFTFLPPQGEYFVWPHQNY